MQSRALVSVVIPAYNYARFLPAAIESVLAQSYTPIELIVVDDGSTDETPQVVAAYGGRLRYIRQDNSGVSAARNNGIRAASGEYVAFLDADDVWKTEKLQRQMELYALHPGAGCIGCDAELFDKDREPTQVSRLGNVLGAPDQRVRDVLRRREWVGGSCSGALVRRIVLRHVGLFDEGLVAAEDWDLWLRIVQHYPVYNVREPLVRIRRHFTGTFRNADKMEHSQLAVLRLQTQRTPSAIDRSTRRQVMAMIWIDSALERMFARGFWSGAERLVRAIIAWPFRADVWRLLAVCVIRGMGLMRPAAGA